MINIRAGATIYFKVTLQEHYLSLLYYLFYKSCTTIQIRPIYTIHTKIHMITLNQKPERKNMR